VWDADDEEYYIPQQLRKQKCYYVLESNFVATDDFVGTVAKADLYDNPALTVSDVSDITLGDFVIKLSASAPTGIIVGLMIISSIDTDGTVHVKITGQDRFVFADYTDFPVVGDARKLYYALDRHLLYYWDTATTSYVPNYTCTCEYNKNTAYKKNDLVYLGAVIARVVADFTSDDTQTTVQDAFGLDIRNGNIIPTMNYTRQYDLTAQVDGVKTTFVIPDSITEDMAFELYYAGQWLQKDVDYVVDYIAHTVTTLLEDPVNSNDDRHLVLVIGKVLPSFDKLTAKYNLTDQVDGVNKVFDIDANISASNSIQIFYNGKLLEEGINYSIDYIAHTITTMDAMAWSTLNDEQLIVYVGELTSVDMYVNIPRIANMMYDLTGQMDGVKYVFDIDAGIPENSPTSVYYAGQWLVPSVDGGVSGDYLIDWTAKTLTLFMGWAPSSDDGRHLNLLVRQDLTYIPSPTNVQHNTLVNRSLPNQHPISSITGLESMLDGLLEALEIINNGG